MKTTDRSDNQEEKTATGLIYGIAAYLSWGFFPVFFKAIDNVPPLQVLSHRIAWSFAFLLLLSARKGKFEDIKAVFREKRTFSILFSTSILIAANWLVFIIAVGHGDILQSSLGYFITPFVSVLLGLIFLKERLRKLQMMSIFLAACGVVIITANYGSFPWVAIILAITFGSYGLLRKIVKTDALAGLAFETIILAPFALILLLTAAIQGNGAFISAGGATSFLLASSGLLTAIPLLLFAAAARRLKMATIAFLQYITPTVQFILAVLVYREPFTLVYLYGFFFIWCALFLYSLDAWKTLMNHRKGRKEAGFADEG